MDKKRILLLGAMGILLAAAIGLGAVWIMEAAEYAGYKADYVDIAEDVLHSDEDDGMIELVPLSPAPKQNDILDDPTAPATTDPRSTAEPSSESGVCVLYACGRDPWTTMGAGSYRR